MRLDDLFDEVQAHAGAVGAFSRVVRLENPVRVFRLDSGARIADTDDDLVSLRLSTWGLSTCVYLVYLVYLGTRPYVALCRLCRCTT